MIRLNSFLLCQHHVCGGSWHLLLLGERWNNRSNVEVILQMTGNPHWARVNVNFGLNINSWRYYYKFEFHKIRIKDDNITEWQSFLRSSTGWVACSGLRRLLLALFMDTPGTYRLFLIKDIKEGELPKPQSTCFRHFHYTCLLLCSKSFQRMETPVVLPLQLLYTEAFQIKTLGLTSVCISATEMYYYAINTFILKE